jgi:uncharacterized membrane protein
MIAPPTDTLVEAGVIAAVQWLRLLVEAIGAAVIAIGIVSAAATFARHLRRSVEETSMHTARRVLAHYLAIALEFQLAADILSTAVAPSWDQIGKLAAIAVIRTALNYFLTREMREARGGV